MRARPANLFVETATYLPDGQAVQEWTLVGAGGLTLHVLNFGGIVTRMLVPDRVGKIDDVVLGFDEVDSYLGAHPYFGAITGRVAGRLTGATFSLDGNIHRLSPSEGSHHLHGGIKGFDKRIWTATSILRHDESPCLQLGYTSPAGEEGYPGKVEVTITYTVLPDNTFQI